MLFSEFPFNIDVSSFNILFLFFKSSILANNKVWFSSYSLTFASICSTLFCITITSFLLFLTTSSEIFKASSKSFIASSFSFASSFNLAFSFFNSSTFCSNSCFSIIISSILSTEGESIAIWAFKVSTIPSSSFNFSVNCRIKSSFSGITEAWFLKSSTSLFFFSISAL